jgi:hypothetical protein
MTDQPPSIEQTEPHNKAVFQVFLCKLKKHTNILNRCFTIDNAIAI